MEAEKLQRIVLAALLHDTGKLFERGNVFQGVLDDPACLEACPKSGASHRHAAHTKRFCQKLAAWFDCLKNTEEDWMIWCAAHHRDDETSQEASVVRMADRLSSQEREPGDYYRRDIHRKTRLEPVLERVFLSENKSISTKYRYPLARIDSKKENFFPQPGSELGLSPQKYPDQAVQPDQWTHLVADAPLVSEYEKLGQGLLDEIAALPPALALSDLIVCLMTLLERYTANVPSATNLRHPDISLFDHLRTTAAIAQALWLHLEASGEKRVALSEKDPQARWTLVCGDFSGIQKFIYNLTNKGAAKGLRGRSFYVSYFCRVCADFILRQLGLTRAALLYNSGGKFYMLLPRHMEAQLQAARKAVNGWLLDHFGADLFFGLGLADITAGMFQQGRMDQAWTAAALALEKDRRQKFREFLSPGFFAPNHKGFTPQHSCPICGSRNMKAAGQESCADCKKLMDLGRRLKDAQAILTVWGEESENTARQAFGPPVVSILEASGFFLNAADLEKLPELKGLDGECVFLNEQSDQRFETLPLPECGVCALYVGKWDPNREIEEPTAEGYPGDFKRYADKARGIKRLGVLRMDVDNLGDVFIRGLSFPQRHPLRVNGAEKAGWGDVVYDESGKPTRRPMASISRMATLSRQLNHFFSAHVPGLLEQERFNRCQVIYAGGDDLFIIGSWDQMPELAETIRAEFRSFCCQNPDFTISGGLILQKEKYPIYKGAELAGNAESAGKTVRYKRGETADPSKKDGFCFLGVPVLWEDFVYAKDIRTLLEKDIGKTADSREGQKAAGRNRGFLAYLSRMTAGHLLEVRKVCREMNMSEAQAWERLKFSPWRWRVAYQLKRRYQKDQETINQWGKILFEADHVGLPVFSWLAMPLRWVEFLHRKRGGE